MTITPRLAFTTGDSMTEQIASFGFTPESLLRVIWKLNRLEAELSKTDANAGIALTLCRMISTDLHSVPFDNETGCGWCKTVEDMVHILGTSKGDLKFKIKAHGYSKPVLTRAEQLLEMAQWLHDRIEYHCLCPKD